MADRSATESGRRPSLAFSTLTTFGTSIAVAVLSLVNVLIIARALGPVGRGDVAFLTTIACLASQLALVTIPAAAAMAAAAPLLCVVAFGEEFHGAVDDLRILTAGSIGIIALKLLGNALSAQRKPMLETAVIATAFVATTTLDVPLSPRHGGLGAVIASSAAEPWRRGQRPHVRPGVPHAPLRPRAAPARRGRPRAIPPHGKPPRPSLAIVALMTTVERYDSVGRLRPEWDELADCCGAAPWLRPGWFAPWWSQFGRGRLAILAVRRGGRLAGVLPIALRAGVRTSLANWHTPEFAPIAETEGDYEALARALLDGARHRVELRFLERDHLAHTAFVTRARETRWRVIVSTLESSPYLEIRGDWASYAATKRGAFLADMRRRRRRLKERGSVTVDVRDGTERLGALLEEGFRIEAQAGRRSAEPRSARDAKPCASTKTSPAGRPNAVASACLSCA